MATSEQRSRRAAQRATAKAVRQARSHGARYQPRVSRETRAAVRAGEISYVNAVLEGRLPEPAPGSPEAKQLARYASYGSRGKADPRFEAAFSKYWYHKKDKGNEADVEDEADYEDEEDEDE